MPKTLCLRMHQEEGKCSAVCPLRLADVGCCSEPKLHFDTAAVQAFSSLAADLREQLPGEGSLSTIGVVGDVVVEIATGRGQFVAFVVQFAQDH